MEDGCFAVADRRLCRRLFGGQSAAGRTLRVKRDRSIADVETREAVFGTEIAVRGTGGGLERAARSEVEAMGRCQVIKSALRS